MFVVVFGWLNLFSGRSLRAIRTYKRCIWHFNSPFQSKTHRDRRLRAKFRHTIWCTTIKFWRAKVGASFWKYVWYVHDMSLCLCENWSTILPMLLKSFVSFCYPMNLGPISLCEPTLRMQTSGLFGIPFFELSENYELLFVIPFLARCSPVVCWQLEFLLRRKWSGVQNCHGDQFSLTVYQNFYDLPFVGKRNETHCEPTSRCFISTQEWRWGKISKVDAFAGLLVFLKKKLELSSSVDAENSVVNSRRKRIFLRYIFEARKYWRQGFWTRYYIRTDIVLLPRILKHAPWRSMNDASKKSAKVSQS